MAPRPSQDLLHSNTELPVKSGRRLSYEISSPTQECKTGVTQCSAGYVDFGAETIGAFETRTDPTASTTSSRNAGSDMSFITIPVDGFYEITLIADPSALVVSDPDEIYETTRIEANFAAVKFDSSDPSQGTILPNDSAMDTPRLDGTDVDSDIKSRSSIVKGDSTGDGAQDFTDEDIEAGVKKEVYLKAGDGVTVFYWIFYANGNTPVGSDNITFDPGSVKIKIKRVID